MEIFTPELQQLIETLVDKLSPEDCYDTEEYRLAKELQALPLGYDLWSYCFLKADGECISTGWEPAEISRSHDNQSLIRAIVWASARFPQFLAFIPNRPSASVNCALCGGTKTWGQEGGTQKPAKCFFCAGLGWVLPEALEQINRA